MPYVTGAPGPLRQNYPSRPATELSDDEVERINVLVRELRERLVTEAPQEVKTVEPARPGLAGVLGRAFRRS